MEPLPAPLGTALPGVDLCAAWPPTPSTWALLERALSEHGLVHLRGQASLAPERIVDFGAHWRTELAAPAATSPQRKPWLDVGTSKNGVVGVAPELEAEELRRKQEEGEDPAFWSTAATRINRRGQPDPDGEIRRT